MSDVIVMDYPVVVEEEPLTAATQVHTGAMIALVPSDADLARLALEDGEPAEELHLTLAYLGEAADISDEMRQQIITQAAQYFTSPVSTEAFSVNVFNPHNPEMATALVLGVKGEELEGPRSNVVSAVRGFFNMPEQHAPWIPHVTMIYTDELTRGLELTEKLGPITFDKIRFAFGGEVTDLYLGAPLIASFWQEEFPMSENEVLTAATRLDKDLLKYWLGPKGSARVGGWGNEGSFRACQREMRKEGVPGRMIDGLCANLYRAATGRHPGRKKEEHSVMTADGYVNELVDVETGAEETPAYAAWEGILTVEGIESGDGRLFSLGSLDWAQLPLPLMYQPANTGGHSGSVMVGQITNVVRKNNQLYGYGIIDLAARHNGDNIGQEVHRLMSEEFLNGVSVDVDKVKDADVEFVYGNMPGDLPAGKPKMTIFHRGRVRGATLVAFPAFVEAQLYLTGEMLTAAAVDITQSVNPEDALVAAAGWAEDEEFLALMHADNVPLTAAGHTITIPDLPPAWWFDEPTDVKMKGALTVTDEGRVYGLLAPKDTTHRAVKTKVPTRNVDYSRFMGRETIVEGGGRVVTGVITMNCGHAPTQNYGTLEDRIEHYDNSCSVAANIRIGETADGEVWVAGATAPFATPEQVTRMLSCTLSGDWQPHPDRPGVREFIAALLVPVPGFAMARQAASVRYEDGALVAAAIPVVYEQIDKSSVNEDTEILLAAGTRKKRMMKDRLYRKLNERKVKAVQRLGRES